MNKRIEIKVAFRVYEAIIVAGAILLAVLAGLALGAGETPVARSDGDLIVPLVDPRILEYEFPLQKIERYELTIKDVIQRSLFLIAFDQAEPEDTQAHAFALAASIHEGHWASFSPEDVTLIQYAVPKMWGADVIARMNQLVEGLIE